MKCKTCRFFDGDTGSSYGLCRRDTPVLGSDGGTGIWPVVNQSDWCGEYEPQPDPERDSGPFIIEKVVLP